VGHFQNVKLQPKRKNKRNTINLHQDATQKNICIIGVSYGRQVQPFTTPFLQQLTFQFKRYSFYLNSSTNINLNFKGRWYWDQIFLKLFVKHHAIACMAFDIIKHPHICLENLVMGMKTIKTDDERKGLNLNSRTRNKKIKIKTQRLKLMYLGINDSTSLGKWKMCDEILQK